jgi:hypothetical protein
MPSGNLFGQENLKSYIEALARVDINSTDTITNQILGLINDINETIKPDVVLIDSRTGFNDVFGFLINRISNTIVGLFEGNKQTEPGMKLFLNEIYKEEHNNSINAILVNSLVHKDSGYSKRLKEFSRNVNDYLIELTEKNYAPEIFDLRKSNILGNLGTIEDDKDDYFEFIKESTPNDYQKFFDRVIEVIEFKKKVSKFHEIDIIESNDVQNKPIVKLGIDELQTNILTKIYDNYPQNYAENITYNEDFLNKKFYLRKCMEDIFNFDKFLLIGGKGTGKTTFYSALKNDDFLKNLQRKASKNQLKFIVIDIVSIKENKDSNKLFEIKNFNQKNIEDKEFFYKRFWTIYILNSILLDIKKLKDYKISEDISKILATELTNSTINKLFFEKIIKSDEKFILVEEELTKIDLFLKKQDLNLMITFDQLDHIVKPILWSIVVSPLIDYCRSMPYLKIQPKLFLRHDLYKKLGNITNKNSLDSNIIKLEWSKDEIFAFFFKVVFSYAKDDFFQIIEKYGDISSFKIKVIQKKINKKNSYNQIDLDKEKILILVETFFGEYQTTHYYKNRNDGKIYDWFYNNLADANKSISLRPFLELIKLAIQMYKNDKSKKIGKPILSSDYYLNQEIRVKCVKQHFDDLASEEGNEDLKKIIEHIRDSSRFPDNLRYRSLKPVNYDKFLNYFLENSRINLNSKTQIEIEELLILNGIISIEYKRGSKKQCTFAYLYKYYLGLKG